MTRITTTSTNAEILRVLHETADAVYGVLSTNTDWGLVGPTRHTVFGRLAR
jgi:hypothetical protein